MAIPKFDELFNDKNMWMVRAGPDSFLIDDFIENNIVAIGWNLGDLTKKSKEKIYDLFQNKYGHTRSANQVIKFIHDIKIDDYVLTYDNNSRTYFLGKITSDYYRTEKISQVDDSNDNYYDTRTVEWLGKIPRDLLQESTKATLGTQITVFNIKDEAKRDIFNVFSGNMEAIENSARIIKDYLEENGLGSLENKEYEDAYVKFKELFSPDVLKNLEGMDILNTIFLHDGDKNNLCYNLEFSKDYTFAGSIAGGSAHKYSLFKHNKTNQWTIGPAEKSKVVSEAEAIEIGEKIRDAIVKGANLIENLNLTQISEYIDLEIELGKIFLDCEASPNNQWIHKYFTLIFPEKFSVVHWENMKKSFLEKFKIPPHDWYYALDGQLVFLAKKSGIKRYSLYKDEILALFEDKTPKPPFESDKKRNIIYFGAPGTGKSFTLNRDKDELLNEFLDNYERVTFHPDYSYANFVGTYKPVPDGNNITYKYVPGPFMRIFKKAIINPDKPYLLIIEEINRANVAAVFGDIFQLLDRDENNESIYPIDASEDMKTFINQDKIKLPENLFIWATMNSADQGVFPMDTAFKRRWDFKYFSINHDEKLIENTHVILNDKKFKWNILRKQINDELLSYKLNEDKLMGPFFAFNEYQNEEMPEDVFKDTFKNKIIMYLFEDAARSKRNDLFSGAKTANYVTYSQICEMFDEKGLEIFNFISDEE